jgi:hypothetical protein
MALSTPELEHVDRSDQTQQGPFGFPVQAPKQLILKTVLGVLGIGAQKPGLICAHPHT